jgi:bifunctional non-homologous end joining protein LigD
MRFVVHEHEARRHHFDFRLEIGGALKSWAVPKGPSMDPAEKRLAVRVPDHPVSYIGFEGVIPEGQYGAGLVVIWDQGTFTVSGGEPERDLKRGKLSFTLNGRKLRGGFSLVRMKGRASDWLLIKQADDLAERGFRIASALTPARRQKLLER